MLPEEVVTTSPDLAPRFTGDVVILVPGRKFSEFDTIPVIDPSAPCLKLLTTGILSLIGAAFFGTAALGAAVVMTMTPTFSGSGVTWACGSTSGTQYLPSSC